MEKVHVLALLGKSMANKKISLDYNGVPILIGSKVRIADKLTNPDAHPEFQKSFRDVAGQIKTVVGWDSTGGAWVPYGDEVLTIEVELLEVITSES